MGLFAHSSIYYVVDVVFARFLQAFKEAGIQ